jgi:endonuclease YncB( thermonuclease family)
MVIRKQFISFDTTVTHIEDGDTVTIIHTDGVLDIVRLLGLDAPEIAHHKDEIAQPSGDLAQKFLSDLILNKKVTIQSKTRDPHGRLLGRILLNGVDVNLTLLENGWAWLYYPQNLPKEIVKSYILANTNAQSQKLGLFANPNAILPNEWRKTHLKNKPIPN